MSAPVVDPAPDPRRWWVLVLAILAVTPVVIDTTVLTVAIPTIMRDLDASLTAVQWVLSGYSLVYASLLVVGGRIGDVFGQRRVIAVGALLFGVGSLVAGLSTDVVHLVIGESVIEGMGAALLTPASLAVLSRTFRGRERATAFAVWGATIAAATALGPLLGGVLTTHASWRWAFGINVLVAPVILVGALRILPRDRPVDERPRIDVGGAILIASGTFLLVFGFTQAGEYGWWRPLTDVSVAGRIPWPATMPVSPVPIAFAASAVLLAAFVTDQLRKERLSLDPLFAFSEFRVLTFRHGAAVAFLMSVAQYGVLLVMPLFLQQTKGLSAVQNGLWVCPLGLTAMCAAPVGARLAGVIGTTAVVRVGVLASAAGLVAEAFLLRPSVTFLQLLPALVVYGVGSGFANSQLTNVILADTDPARTGAASGINTTGRQVGGALGVAVIGAVFVGVAADHGIADAVKPAVLASAGAMLVAAVAAWRIPHAAGEGSRRRARAAEPADEPAPADARAGG